MHISITGKLGSGKSTVCHLIEKEYGFEIFSTGSIQREAARQKGVSTLELNRMMQNDCSLDYIIDDTVNRLSRERKEDKLIFDSRMAWHFVQESFKVFLNVDPLIAAERVMANPRGCEECYASVEEACEKLVERSRVENARFSEIYGLDYFDLDHYDLVVDSSHRTPQEIVELIMQNYSIFCADPVEFGRRRL